MFDDDRLVRFYFLRVYGIVGLVIMILEIVK